MLILRLKQLNATYIKSCFQTNYFAAGAGAGAAAAATGATNGGGATQAAGAGVPETLNLSATLFWA